MTAAQRIRRLWYRRKVRPGDMSNALMACWESIPEMSQKCSDSDFLVADLETSSLDSATGDILSIGWVIIRKGKILPLTAEQHLLKPRQSVGESAVIHQLRDCELETGNALWNVLMRFLNLAAGKVLVFHHAKLDLSFLNRVVIQQCGSPLLLPCADTLVMEMRSFQRQQKVICDGDLRLYQCRRRYHLPDYPAHDALTDAIAAAELFLAQLSHRDSGVRLSDTL